MNVQRGHVHTNLVLHHAMDLEMSILHATLTLCPRSEDPTGHFEGNHI